MTTTTRNAVTDTVASPGGLGVWTRRLSTTRHQDPERAERRRVAREIAAYPASRGLTLSVR